MKYRYFLLTALAVAAIAGCAKNEPAAPNEPVGGEEVRTPAGTSLTAVIDSEEDADGKAAVADNGAVTWTKGDALSVYDGSAFQTFTLQGEGGSASGTFVAENPVAAKRVAVYPAGSHSLSGNTLTVNLPASYTLASVDDANTNVPMIATGDFATGQLSFKQVGGLFRFTHYTVPPAARKFRFAANGHKINGDFEIDINASEPTLVAGASSSAADSVVTVNFPAPTDTVEMSFFIPIPTESYNNFTISLLDGSDNVLWTNTTGSPAGTSTIDIARKSFKKMPAVGGIKTAKELMDLATRVNASKSIDRYKDCKGEITLRNDIDMSAYGTDQWVPIGGGGNGEKNEFSGNFNGRGHTIDNLKRTFSGGSGYMVGLFGVLATGTQIRNLTLGENCAFDYTYTKGSYVRAGGIICFSRYATNVLSNLTYHGTLNVKWTTASSGTYVGGICGQSRANPAQYLTNTGAVTVTYTGSSNSQDYNIGGVIGRIDSGTPTIRNLTNTGSVSLSNTLQDATTSNVYLGGVIGRNTVAANIKQCVNDGSVTCTFTYKAAIVGGVIGRTEKGTLTNLKNTGTITLDSKHKSSYVGGVAGYVAGIPCTNLFNTGQIRCNETSATSINADYTAKCNMGGVIGHVSAAGSVLAGLVNNGVLYGAANEKMGGIVCTTTTNITLSDSAFGGSLQCVSGQGGDIGLVMGTNGYTADTSTLSNIKISGSFGPSGSQSTIASAEDYTTHVQTDYSKTWANDKTKMRLVNPTNSDNTVKKAVYDKFLHACSYGTMSTDFTD